MSENGVARILILAQPAAAARCCIALQADRFRLWHGRGAIPPGDHPDLILTDACQDATPRDDIAMIRLGVCSNGAARPGDVDLPSDCTDRELQLACRLAAQVVRLRREVHLAETHGRAMSLAAMTDPLTGLPNRRAWDVEIERRTKGLGISDGGLDEHDEPPRLRLCVAVVDLDCLKPINDTLGHAAGDRVLVETGRALQTALRQGDFVARLGGDEFGLLLDVPSEAAAVTVLNRVRAKVAQYAAIASDAPVTASIGFAVASCECNSEAGDALFDKADRALSTAKQSGRNRVCG